jgi:hypothetical protein
MSNSMPSPPPNPVAQAMRLLVEDAQADAVVVLYSTVGADHDTEVHRVLWGNQCATREMIRMEYADQMAQEFTRRGGRKDEQP